MADAIADPGASKRTLLDLLKRRGPSDAGDLAKLLGVTAMAVRQHLYGLEADGLVSFTAAPATGGRGRPSKLWQVERPADALFPDAHADLSVELIANIKEVFGARGLDKLIAKRTAHQIALYRAALSSATSLKDKVKRLARLRSEAGYMAEMSVDGEGFVLIENHCPVCRAAVACTGLCRQELDVFRAALGRGITIQRTEHILTGARRCAYRIWQN